MEQALPFFSENEVYIYLFVGLIAAWQLRKVFLAWNELRAAAFGLERESAQGRLNRAVSILVFAVILGLFEFALVTYVVPNNPESAPLFTPTLNLLATPTAPMVDEAGTPLATTPEPQTGPIDLTDLESNCQLDQVMILSPTSGETVQDIVEIIGTANIPNFGFYKYEATQAGEENWLTIQAGNSVVIEDRLGYWDTARLTPGDYLLRLIVTDNEGQPSPPCVIQVRVAPPVEE
ncbi:MAG: hypothetical protein JW862_06435 [Anaerolineales bacterium]|nr:hypothetical protein [Anaerolineales bacterium]